MKVVLTDEALQDLRSAVEFLQGKDPDAAADLIARTFELAQQLAHGDFEGPEIRLSRGERVRSWPVRPYRLYYRREEGALVVLRVYHGARRPL